MSKNHLFFASGFISRENQEEHILLGMKMKFPHQTPHQVKMKRQTYA